MKKTILRLVIVLALVFTFVGVLASCSNHICVYEVSSQSRATCINDGVDLYKCMSCGEGYTKEVKASELYHLMGEENVVHTASCETDDTLVSICQYCGYKKERADVGTRYGHNYGEFISKDGETMVSSCSRCDSFEEKPVPEKTHTLSLLKGDSTSYSETDLFKCETCDVKFEIDDVLEFEISNANQGYSVKISSKFEAVQLTTIGLTAIKPSLSLNYDGEFGYETVEDIAKNASELIIGENVSKIYDLFLFEKIKRITIDEDVKFLASKTFVSCALLTEIYMEGDCPEHEDATFFVASRELDSENKTGIYAPTVYYKDGKKGYSGRKLQGCNLSMVGEAIPDVPEMTIGEYSNKAAEKAETYAEYFLKALAKSDSKLHLLPYASLEKYAPIYTLANELTKNLTSEKEKARAIFEWIVENITYDLEAQCYPVEIVFEERKAVCNGYVLLMHDMLTAVGITSAYTHGISISDIYDRLTVSEMLDGSYNDYNKGHAWLYVYADGELILCDPTWNEFDITPSHLAISRLTTGFYGITVAPDEIDPRNYGEYILFENDELVYLIDGKLTQFSSNSLVFNYSMMVTYTYVMSNNGYEIIGALETGELSTAYKNIIIEYSNMGYRYRNLFDAAYNTYNYIDVLKGIAFAKLNGIEFSTNLFELDSYVFDDYGNVYMILSESQLELIGTVCPDSVLTVPSKVGTRDVVTIGWGAFMGCYASEIILPSTVTEIKSTAFSSCPYLTEIRIPNSVKELGVSLFTACTRLEKVYLPSSIELIGLKTNNETCIPYAMFSELSPETLSVYYDGTKEEFDRINFYNAWGDEENGYFDSEHYAHILPFMVFE